ncbi:MAG: asparaginase [Acidimicrobiia bacterium]|nr:asparaginase [Acidimicrobiia bacterium]
MTLLGRVIRSGVVEAEHHGAVAVVAPDGRLIASMGDIDRVFHGRSSLKPFQARAALDLGALVTGPSLAVSCASHGGLPIHVAYVRSMLARVGLTEASLLTPATWPASDDQGRRYFAAGQTHPLPIWHGCSGKHAAMLQACVVAGFPTESYLSFDHPLQARIRNRLAEALGHDLSDPAVDGCGAPVYEVSVRSLAGAFARLAVHPEYRDIWTAMHRYPALVGENPRADQLAATVAEAAAKVGAEGLIGVGLRSQFGIAIKSWDGSIRGIEAGLVGTMEQLGLLNGSSRRLLRERLIVLGGGEPQGHVEPTVELV